MDNARATRWLQTPMGRTIVAQIEADPGLPQSSSTISSWQVPFHPDVGRIQSEALPQLSDYVVIGSGVAGCGVVKSLLENSSPTQSSVTVLEARGLCSGATGRNGGQLVKPYPSRFVQLAQDFGIEIAVKVFRLANYTLEEMHKLAGSYDDQLPKDAAARRVTKMVAFMDQRSWIQGQKDAKFYEQHMPEERGLFKFLTKEQMEKVKALSKGQRAYLCALILMVIARRNGTSRARMAGSHSHLASAGPTALSPVSSSASKTSSPVD